MAHSHYLLLANCTDEQLRRICECRKIPIPQHWEVESEGRVRLLKTMIFHLEDNKRLTNTLADLDSRHLRSLKNLAEYQTPPEAEAQQVLMDLGLILPSTAGWVVIERVADALADFDDGAFNFQGASDLQLLLDRTLRVLPGPHFRAAALHGRASGS